MALTLTWWHYLINGGTTFSFMMARFWLLHHPFNDGIASSVMAFSFQSWHCLYVHGTGFSQLSPFWLLHNIFNHEWHRLLSDGTVWYGSCQRNWHYVKLIHRPFKVKTCSLPVLDWECQWLDILNQWCCTNYVICWSSFSSSSSYFYFSSCSYFCSYFCSYYYYLPFNHSLHFLHSHLPPSVSWPVSNLKFYIKFLICSICVCIQAFLLGLLTL